MRMTPVINYSLLKEIYDAKQISYDELWNKKSNMVKALFDEELETLVKNGYVQIEDGVYTYIHS